ncbi:unnamed protein product [Ambrosiozyma monospora]|uniref:Unnamed protein product n=1 Tax=Ambrosiozyma monospora TaxID=43982 RepID=A0ACB5TZF1_AMBMO|nr:unnamed protein product [Ambrosiozyma monospora]
MYRCFTFLDKEEAVKQVGTFRLSGLKAEINRIQEIFNLKGDFDLLHAVPKPNIHSVTTLFKRWLRENEKVLSNEECEQLLKLALLKNDSIKTKEFNSILMTMPPENYQILKCTMKYLDNVLDYKELNKNSEESLAMLFSASLTEDKMGKNIPVLREFLKNRKKYFC